MPDIINLLPHHIANQIAAGEVVQRPASVVKELMENALDAGATHITLIIKDAGKTLIEIIDNGKGMTQTDARMCFERHATSKIKTTEDLFSVYTMGFRGEAMASIAAVAQVELKTQTEADETGTHIIIEGSEVKQQQPCFNPHGTKLLVKNLFYNVPARRNFLKSNPVETRHIIDEFQRLALGRPDIEFEFYNHETEVFSLKPSDIPQRICAIFGNEMKENLVPIEINSESIQISGYLGNPITAKKSRNEQFFFVNGRFIKSHYLNHAVVNAYESSLPQGMVPFYLIQIKVDPRKIDVNVHPTKTEIKFEDEKTMYALLRSGVKRALGSFNLLDSNPNHSHSDTSPAGMQDLPGSEIHKMNAIPFSQHINITNQKAGNSNWQSLFPENQSNNPRKAELPNIQLQLDLEPSFHLEGAENEYDISELNDRLLLVKLSNGVRIINKIAAFERIIFERLLSKNNNTEKVNVRKLLFPKTIEVAATDIVFIEKLRPDLENIGFDFEIFGKTSLILHGVPAELNEDEAVETFHESVQQNSSEQDDLGISRKEALAKRLASKIAAQKIVSEKGSPLKNTSFKDLVQELMCCENKNYAPSGSLIQYDIPFSEMNSRFNLK